MNVPVLAEDGARTGDAELRDEIFAAKVNPPLMHQVVTAQLAAARAGTHSTRTRGEVRGGGRKPWRQKGTGRARHGSIREPQWVGGGIAFGPKPRSHTKSVNKKMRIAALRSALSARAGEGNVAVVEDLGFDVPKTKRAVKALASWSVEGKILVVLARGDRTTAYAFRNIPAIHIVAEDQLNTYDVVKADVVVFTRSALDAFQDRFAPRGESIADVAREPAAAETVAAPAGEAAASAVTTDSASSVEQASQIAEKAAEDAPTPEAGEEGAR